jgi:DNA-binding response OmpR family regulator
MTSSDRRNRSSSRRQRGRPISPPDALRRDRITVKLTREECRRLQYLAKQHGRSLRRFFQ